MYTAQVIVIDPKQKRIYDKACRFNPIDMLAGMREIIGAADIIDVDVQGIKKLLTRRHPFIELPRYTYMLIGKLSAYKTVQHYFEYSRNGFGIGVSIIVAYDEKSRKFIDCQYTAEEVTKLFRFCGNYKTEYFAETLKNAKAGFNPLYNRGQKSTLDSIIKGYTFREIKSN